MASIFRQSNQSQLFSKKKVSRRQTQSMASYFSDVLTKWRWFFISLAGILSATIIFTHKPSHTEARSLIVFHQSENGAQVGIPSSADLMAGGRSSNRDRQLHFMQSNEFYRLLSEAILTDSAYESERAQLTKLSSVSLFGINRGKKQTLRNNQLKELLKKIVSFTPNGENAIMAHVHTANTKISRKLAAQVTTFAIAQIQDGQLHSITADNGNLLSQIGSVKGEIETLNEEVQSFKIEHNLLSVQTLPDDLRNSLSNLSKSLLDAEIQLQENDYMIKETSKRSEESNQRVLATKGVGYHDQVLETRRQELVDQRAMLKAKIRGLKKIIEQERSRFNFMSSGEEKISQIKSKIDAKLTRLNQLEQQQKTFEGLIEQVNHKVRMQGEVFLHEDNSSMPLSLKLVLLNITMFFICGMGLYYWYEVFPVISYRDPQIAELDLSVMPWFGGSGLFINRVDSSIRAHAQRLCAQKVIEQVNGPGVHQVLSAESGEGKTLLVAMLARELVKRGEKVCIIDLNCRGKYEDLPSEVRIIKDATTVQSIINSPTTVKFAAQGASWILVDSAALNKQMGHLLVSPFMDGIIFVGSYLQTKTKSFTDWKLKIEQLVGKKAVFVLNKTDLRVDLPFLLMAPAMKEELQTNRKVS